LEKRASGQAGLMAAAGTDQPLPPGWPSGVMLAAGTCKTVGPTQSLQIRAACIFAAELRLKFHQIFGIQRIHPPTLLMVEGGVN
jgi:hypothetical protein